jgi:hypothetical protein
MMRNCCYEDMKQLDGDQVAGPDLDTYRNSILAW